MSLQTESAPITIIGAGPAGLSAGHELTQRGISPLILEQLDRVGGISRTESWQGFRFDLGGHRFFTHQPEVQAIWEQMLGEDFLRVQRLSRILYDGKFYQYPLEVLEIPQKLGLVRSARVFLSWLQFQIKPFPEEDTFEHWVCNRFGRYLFEIFFKNYTEKVWGIPCSEIKAEWAAQRIRGLSLPSALWGSLFNNHRIKTLAREFRYPLLGPGMMWERFAQHIQSAGGRIWTQCRVSSLENEGGKIRSLTVEKAGTPQRISTDYVISSMAMRDLILSLDPPPPPEILAAAQKLKYRDFILVGLVLDQVHPFKDQWLYVHEPRVRVGRIQNFRNWSAAMLPDDSKTSLGMEFFCSQGDDLWNMSDTDLIDLASREIEALHFAPRSAVEGGCVIRQPLAYPVYDHDYQENIQSLRSYLSSFSNLQTIGRNGMHRYNNQDHSMLMGILAARNYLGENHDLAQVNMEQAYYEDLVENGNGESSG